MGRSRVPRYKDADGGGEEEAASSDGMQGPVRRAGWMWLCFDGCTGGARRAPSGKCGVLLSARTIVRAVGPPGSGLRSCSEPSLDAK